MAASRARILILGTGWGGNKLARILDKTLFDVRLVSPANHFLFTPLLPSTAVGTLEFRAIQEPVRTIPGLQEYYQAKASSLDVEKRVVDCQDLYSKQTFSLPFDYLVLACGSKTNTFNTPGVASNEGQDVFFLKHLHHARSIRNRVIECFERASNPMLTLQQADALLSFVVVGGGPTSCEFATELKSLLDDDMPTWYPHLAKRAKVTVIEAGHHILGSFDSSLVQYYEDNMKARGINLLLDMGVKGIVPSPSTSTNAAVFPDGRTLPFGCLVWSAGLAPVNFVSRLTNLPKHPRSQRIIIDPYLRVPGTGARIFAIGDCAASDTAPLPPTASVAEQQASYLGECFNESYGRAGGNVAGENAEPPPKPVVPHGMPWPALRFIDKLMFKPASEFKYIERGAMASLGFGKGVADLTKAQLGNPHVTVTGVGAFITWRGAYWSKQLSWSNMILVPMFWFKTILFGRDISRF
jgi:NADH dehydrogenase/NADH:ubiquinone reductase (non-electrogenic)